jgi:predicted metallo-beta-lactamase superfamily hydrolase
LKITPLASDSMGVRSAATVVESGGHKIIIDPGAALAPVRYGLEPSPQELAALKFFKSKINAEARKSDVIIISHYHHDHFNPRANFYRGKDIFVKSWKNDINYSQHQRAGRLQEKFKRLGVVDRMRSSDGTHHEIDADLELLFSPALPHGPVGTEIGYVVMTTITDGNYRFMHCSDVLGPVEPSTARMIIDADPDLVYIDGPPTNLLDTHFSHADLEKAINNILDIISLTRARVILDHHLLRDGNFRKQMVPVYDLGDRVVSAAEFIGVENALMEASRDKLWQKAGEPYGKDE